MTPEPSTPPQRRHFSRVAFAAPAELTIGAQAHTCKVLDLSLKGALLQMAASGATTPGRGARLSLPLADGTVDVIMDGSLVACTAELAHFRCEAIDLDSVTHLRRLVELNAGDAALLDRELAALTAHA